MALFGCSYRHQCEVCFPTAERKGLNRGTEAQLTVGRSFFCFTDVACFSLIFTTYSTLRYIRNNQTTDSWSKFGKSLNFLFLQMLHPQHAAKCD